jgi:hypothetical protein
VIPTIDIAAPPVVCAHCGREIEIRYLFCLPCALERLDDTAIVAHAKSIRSMSKKPIGRTCARTDCVICGKPVPAGAMASLLTRHVAAHIDCMRGLQARLDELLPQQEMAAAGGFLFDGPPIEDRP